MLPPASAAWREAGKGIVLHEQTGLRWQDSDNGKDISWIEAGIYCRKFGGKWRLPSVDELAALAAAAAGDTARNLPLFKLGGSWFWSEAALTESDSPDFKQLAWGMSLTNGRKTMAFRLADFRSRALCVDGASIQLNQGAKQ
jgi:hypothetical protein